MNCGIYEILHVQTGFRYIGMSRRIEERYYEHLRRLNTGKHHCMLLQLAWKKHGEGAFVFRCLETVTPSATKEFLLRREKAWQARSNMLLFNPAPSQKATAPQRRLSDLRRPLAVAVRSQGKWPSPTRAEERRSGIERRRWKGQRAGDPV